MSTKIIDSTKKGAIGEQLKEIIKKNAMISISSPVLTIYALSELSNSFNKSKSINFLFNKPSFIEFQQKHEVREFEIQKMEREKSLSEFPYEIKLKNNLNQRNIAKKAIGLISSDRFNIKSVKDNNFSSRDILIDNKDSFYRMSGYDLELSLKGLGYCNCFVDSATLDDDLTTYKSRLAIFNSIWNGSNVIDVKQNVLASLNTLNYDIPPELLYYLTLFNVFNDRLINKDEYNSIQDAVGIRKTKIWNMLFNFQKDAVIGAIHKMQKYNGCIIADSVGLGKTFEALAIIKYYELKNARVLVLCPKKLRDNWTGFKNNTLTNPLIDDKFRYDILNHTDLSREFGMSGDIDLSKINWGNYDLLVIDESHAFRNDNAVKDRMTRYKKLMNEIILNGINTKVLMLSATPVNNSLKDLNNQIRLITCDKDDYLLDKGKEIPSIQSTLRIATQTFNAWQKNNKFDNTSSEQLLSSLRLDFFDLLDTFTIARSRKHIMKYYDTKDIGKFPEREKPISIKSPIDDKKLFPEIKYANDQILRLNLAVYSPILYVMPNKLKKYEEMYSTKVEDQNVTFTAWDRTNSVIKLMTINILKRLESSIESFRLTVSKILNKTYEMIDEVNSKVAKQIISNNEDENFIDEFDDNEDTFVGEKVKIDVNDLDKIKFLAALKDDKELLEELLKKANRIDSSLDAKLNNLKNTITNKIEHPLNEDNKKVIIFTAFSDTARYLYDNIAKWVYDKYGLYTGLVTGSKQSTLTNLPKTRNDFSTILMSFSPKSNSLLTIGKQIDILIATDCISEGQNLQDCDCLINYDIHWNPIKIIQRFGRIDRIGSKNDKIQLINFWPDADLDEYIDLERRVKSKAALVDLTATGDDNLLVQNQKEMEYRAKQLKILQNNIIDLEDAKGGISITDLTLSDYIFALEKYKNEHVGLLEKFPTGVYSIVNIENNERNKNLKPGVVFCLKQNNSQKEKQSSSIYPYFLVYLEENGKVLVENTHPKIVLDIFNTLCKDKHVAISKLVKAFNKDTSEQENMSKYTSLLENAVNNIKGIVASKGIDSLFKLGSSSIVKNANVNIDDFQLITFLVVR